MNTDLPIAVIFPAEIALQQQAAASRSIRFAENLIMRGIVTDRGRHSGEKLKIVFGELGKARQAIGQLGERKTLLHGRVRLTRHHIAR